MKLKEIEKNKLEAIRATVESFAKQLRELEDEEVGYWLIKDTTTEYMNAINRIIND